MKNRIIFMVVLFFIFGALMVVSWEFSGKSNAQSNDVSMRIAEQIEDCLAKHFYINRSDYFWKVSFNHILRKFAHFVEYSAIGTVLCLMLNVAIRRPWIAATISVLISLLLSLLDEYHQKFSLDRTPKMSDVCIDFTGALTGIIFVTIFFLILNYVNRLRSRIKELEKTGLNCK